MTTTCHHCGLEVPADDRGKPKRHLMQALRAGLKEAECVQQANAAEKRRRERAKERSRWERDYRALREQRANADSKLPKHLR